MLIAGSTIKIVVAVHKDISGASSHVFMMSRNKGMASSYTPDTSKANAGEISTLLTPNLSLEGDYLVQIISTWPSGVVRITIPTSFSINPQI